MTTPATLQQAQDFWDQLERHDWFYHFSDDHRVWVRGESDCKRLEDLAESLGLTPMLKAFAEYHFSGESFGKPQAPKPERPT